MTRSSILALSLCTCFFLASSTGADTGGSELEPSLATLALDAQTEIAAQYNDASCKDSSPCVFTMTGVTGFEADYNLGDTGMEVSVKIRGPMVVQFVPEYNGKPASLTIAWRFPTGVPFGPNARVRVNTILLVDAGLDGSLDQAIVGEEHMSPPMLYRPVKVTSADVIKTDATQTGSMKPLSSQSALVFYRMALVKIKAGLSKEVAADAVK
jgi:hypothetical protein